MVLLIALMVATSGCGPLPEESHWTSIDLQPGTLEIRYLPIVGPAPFAPVNVRFYYTDGGDEQPVAETKLHNDGVDPDDRNLEVVRLGDGRWQVVLMGQEQVDERWTVDATGGRIRMAPTP